MMYAFYPTKKSLKDSIGKSLRYAETSIFGKEYRSNGVFCVTNQRRSWFAEVTMKDDLIARVK